MDSRFWPAAALPDADWLAVVAPASPGARILVLLLALYAVAVLFKAAARLRGEWGHVCLVAAIFLVPALTASWFAYGDPFGALHRSEVLPEEASAWWTLSLKQGEAEPVLLSLPRATLLIGLLILAASLLVNLGSLLFARGRRGGWQQIHKVLIKWPIVILGALVLLRIDLSAIVVGTSVAVIGIGFMLKETIENAFTGVALEVEGSVRPGDWITVGGEDVTGQVIEKTWRVTKLRTTDDETISVPNRVLAAQSITNYNRRPHAHVLFARASHDDPPVKVKEILRSVLLSDPAILTDPPPVVRTLQYNDFWIEYDLKFWLDDYAPHRTVRDRVMTSAWYALRSYGVTIPTPVRTVHLKERGQLAEEQAALAGEVQAREDFLRSLPCFAGLGHEDVSYLAQHAFAKRYEPGDHVLFRGEIGDALFLVQTGSCQALLPDGAREIPAGNYFGELGLLGAGPRTADVVAGSAGASVLRVDKHCMDALFRLRPQLRREFALTGEERARELPHPEHATEEVRPPWTRRLLRGTLDSLRPW